jgi:hypothetical protein
MEKQVASQPRSQPEWVQKLWDKFPALKTIFGAVVAGVKAFIASYWSSRFHKGVVLVATIAGLVPFAIIFVGILVALTQ